MSRKYDTPVKLMEAEILSRTTDIYNNWFEYQFSCGKHTDPFVYFDRQRELENGEVIEEEVEIDLDPTDYIDGAAADNTIRYLILTTTKIQDLIFNCWQHDGSTEKLFEDISERLQNGTALDEYLEPYFDAVKKAGV